MDIKTKKKTLRLLSNGLYIMTSRNGDHYGAATVTWISQASFKPPLIMAAVRQDSNVFECLSHSHVAAIHILARDQQDIAQKFFKTTLVDSGLINGEPFINGKTSAPILQNARAYVECQVVHIVNNGGDHSIVVLEVVEAECQEQIRPLTIADTPWEYSG